MKIVAAFLLLTECAGCAYREYDPAKPGEYDSYWKDGENRRSSAAYPFTDEARGRGEKKNPYDP